MAKDEVVLLSLWPSPFGLRVKVALAVKGVEYEYKDEDLLNKTTLLVESNPVHKKIPVLIHNGKPVCESLVIVQYIDEVWTNNPALLPHDAHQRANARFWADFVDKKVYECGIRVWKIKDEEERMKGKEEFIGYLKLLEGELGDKPYFGGEELGYVDVVLVPLTCWFYTFETCIHFSIKEECPKLIEWVERCMTRDSVSTALPDPHRVYDFACAYKKRFGFE